MYPAAFDGVEGVGVFDENGDEVVWATPGPAGRRDASDHKWIDATDQGVGCVGLSGTQNPGNHLGRVLVRHRDPHRDHAW
ncbi:MAG TPA: hypothetical protein VFS66_13850 [Acidimicrobiia bacterium]|nr:hypothetical protein [Acidimicrobiia bacterium]